jgi:hypothetical protein
MSTLKDTNWEEELQDDERGIRRKGKDKLEVVFLAGLQRLARKAGIVESSCDIQTHIAGEGFLVQAVYTARFEDGSVWSGAGDCTKKNTDPPFNLYPTAIAESRAEARCLKKALGIRLLANEEIGFHEGVDSLEASPNKSIDPQVVKAIEVLCNSRNVDIVTVLHAAVNDKERANNIFQLTDLTVEEGRAAMAWLNDQSTKGAKRKPTAEEKRNARKKELEGRQ